MAKDKESPLQKAFRYVEKSLQAELARTCVPSHPTAIGDIAENAWRKFLRHYLPTRYRVESGFVVDARGGTSEQIDCIIFDNIFTPILWGEDRHFYIPVEAVYAVFEIKQVVNKKHISAAAQKVESVRKLQPTSARYIAEGEEKLPKDRLPIIGGLLATTFGYQDGARSTRFINAVHEVGANQGEKHLNLFLTAFHGYAAYFDTDLPYEALHTDCGKGSATRGLFRLVKALLAQGTVAAINLDYYIEHASKQQNGGR